MKEKIQIQTEDLSNLCLESAEKYHNYTDYDLMNATLIFSHFFMDKIFSENQHLSLEKQCELAETTGKAIRELILSSTGKDMHIITRESIDNKKAE